MLSSFPYHLLSFVLFIYYIFFIKIFIIYCVCVGTLDRHGIKVWSCSRERRVVQIMLLMPTLWFLHQVMYHRFGACIPFSYTYMHQIHSEFSVLTQSIKGWVNLVWPIFKIKNLDSIYFYFFSFDNIINITEGKAHSLSSTRLWVYPMLVNGHFGGKRSHLKYIRQNHFRNK